MNTAKRNQTIWRIVTGLAGTVLLASSLPAAELKWSGCSISKHAYMNELAAAFEKESGIKVNLSGGGATKGIRDVNNGLADLGGSCRHLMVHDEESKVNLIIVGWDAIAVAVHKSNPLQNLSHEALKKILLGNITNWKELGWEDHPIEVFLQKGKTSGVGMMSRELIFGDADVEFAGTQEFSDTEPLEQAMEQAKWSIGLTGISSAKKRALKILDLNGVSPTMDNMLNGKYILTRPLYMVAPTNRSPEVWSFLRFVTSAKGQEIIESQGTVPQSKEGNLLRQYRLLMQDIKGSKKGAFE